MNSPSPNSLLEGYPGRWGVTRPTSLKIFQGFGGLAEDVRLQGIQALLGLEISIEFACWPGRKSKSTGVPRKSFMDGGGNVIEIDIF